MGVMWDMQRKVDCERIVIKVRRKNFKAALIRAKREMKKPIIQTVAERISDKILLGYTVLSE